MRSKFKRVGSADEREFKQESGFVKGFACRDALFHE